MPTAATVSALAALVLFAALLSGAEWLGAETWLFGIPLGNLAAWAGLIALNLVPVLLARGGVLRATSGVCLALALLWLPISITLFGNVFLSNAPPPAWRAWLALTGALLVYPLLALVGIGALAMCRRERRGPHAPPTR